MNGVASDAGGRYILRPPHLDRHQSTYPFIERAEATTLTVDTNAYTITSIVAEHFSYRYSQLSHAAHTNSRVINSHACGDCPAAFQDRSSRNPTIQYGAPLETGEVLTRLKQRRREPRKHRLYASGISPQIHHPATALALTRITVTSCQLRVPWASP